MFVYSITNTRNYEEQLVGPCQENDEAASR